MKINPKDYIYLWTDYDVSYIYASCCLINNYKEIDFLFIYDYFSKGLEFYMSKKDYEKFLKEGVNFYKDISSWVKSIVTHTLEAKQLIEFKNPFQELTDNELKEKFYERVLMMRNLLTDYFYTEFFYIEKAEKEENEIIKNNLKEMGPLKFEARKILNQYYNHEKVFKPFINEISKRRNRDDVKWLSYEEVLNLMDGKEVPFSNRNEKYWLLSKKNDWKLSFDAEEIIKEFHKHFFQKEDKYVSGVIANKGKYVGTIKSLKTVLTNNSSEMQKFEKGQILLAETTGPEMMEACQKAAAIVTDQGGLSSHAAIVSREFGIPCIVGTKYATKIFKDGDLVEVDADNGIVRKI